MKIEKYAILKNGGVFRLVSQSTAFVVVKDSKGICTSVKAKNVMAYRTITKAENVKDAAVLMGRKALKTAKKVLAVVMLFVPNRVVRTAKKLQSYVMRLIQKPKLVGATALFLMMFLCSCHTSTNWTKECAERFPTKTDTFRLTSETVRIDTIQQLVNRVHYVTNTVCPKSKTDTVIKTAGFVECPQSQTIRTVKTVHDSIVIYQENKAALVALQSRYENQSATNNALVKQITAKRRALKILLWCYVGLLLLCLIAAYISYKQRFKGSMYVVK